uniref:Transcription factor like 5 n=1 Tax=Taeniopygia guttata TaxID=59729 RepID=A0A674G9M5_TAEGU
MSGSAPEEPQTIPQSPASAPHPAPAAVRPAGSSDSAFGEQNLGFATPEASLVEMMDIEYTQLQHILCSHTEAQSSEGEVEARLSAFSSPGPSADPPLQQPSPSTSQDGGSSNSSGNQSVCPVTCQSGLPCDNYWPSSNPHLGYADLQELRMMLLSESNLPANQREKAPNSSGSVEVPGCSVAKAKQGENFLGENKENVFVENLALAPEVRSKPAVRARLEDRFNSSPTENPRCQEPQESGVTLNNLVTLIRQPSEVVGVPLHQQGNSANPSQAQTCGTSCTILEAAKHQDLGIPKTFPFIYQEGESTKQTVGTINKALPEEVWIKVGDTLCKQAINRSCSRINLLDSNMDRKPLGEIRNTRDNNQSTAAAQSPWQSAQPSSSVQVQSGSQDGSAQRRERHNRLERDRRRRIRVCCDELNLLVPFCTIDTDKATTLQWTTAFLKYIQERHGDSLKQEFETVFCGKTGRRLKIGRPDSCVMCPAQENRTAMETK